MSGLTDCRRNMSSRKLTCWIVSARRIQNRDGRKIDTDRPYFAEGFIGCKGPNLRGIWQSAYPERCSEETAFRHRCRRAGHSCRRACGGSSGWRRKTCIIPAVIIDHGHGLSSAFLHMQSVATEVGDEVTRSAVRYYRCDRTGDRPHLDWRISWFDVRVDPRFSRLCRPRTSLSKPTRQPRSVKSQYQPDLPKRVRRQPA